MSNSSPQVEHIAVYETLRNHIISCEERVKHLTTQMYIVYFAMLTFGYNYDWIFLVSLIVLLIFQSMINDDRLSIHRASCYIRVFFEIPSSTIHWESLQRDKFCRKIDVKLYRSPGWYAYGYGSAILSIISWAFFFSRLYQQHSSCNFSWENLLSWHFFSSFVQIFISLILCFLIIFEFFRLNKILNCDFYIEPYMEYYQKCYPSEVSETTSVEKPDTDIIP